jgi:hypothetical protein
VAGDLPSGSDLLEAAERAKVALGLKAGEEKGERKESADPED